MRQTAAMIALAIGSESVSVCEVETRGPRVRLLAHAEVEGTSAAAIAEARAASGSRETRAAVSVVDRAALARRITVPRMSDAELAEAIAWEAEQYIPYALEDVALAYRRLRREGPGFPAAGEVGRQRIGVGGETMAVLLAASLREVVDPAVEAAREAGLSPVSWVPQPLCAPAWFCRERPGADRLALVDAGVAQTQITVLAAGAFAQSRQVSAGTGAIAGELVRRGLVTGRAEAVDRMRGYGNRRGGPGPYRGHDGAAAVAAVVAAGVDAIAAEVGRTVEFLDATGDGIDALALTGDGAHLDALGRAIRGRVDRPVETWTPSVDGIDAAADPLVMAAPLGLAIGGLASTELGERRGWLRRLLD